MSVEDAASSDVRFRSADGVAHRAGLGDVTGEVLASALPWRTIRSHRGQRHLPGWWWSSTTGTHVTYQSQLELARLILADFDPAVHAIAARPFLLEAHVHGTVRRYVPDFLLLSDAQTMVVDAQRVDRGETPEKRFSHQWAQRLMTERGWNSEVWSGAAPVMMDNVRFLAGFRRTVMFDAELLTAVGDVAPGRSVNDTETALAALWPRVVVRPAILHLLWSGRLRADLSETLDGDTTLETAA